MKIIHTSDWHLGHQIYGYDRTDEQIHFLDRLKEIVERESPDALVVSGDIFDISMPSAAVSKMFKDRLIGIHNSCPSMTIVVTAGNHDSASRIDIDRNLWRLGGVHVIGTVKRNNGSYDFTDNIIPVGDKGFIAAVPFVNRAFMPRTEENVAPEKSFFDSVAAEVKRMNTADLPVVLMAHLSVTGCDRTGHRDSPIGGVDSVGCDVFDPVFNYVALGHIHKPQKLEGERVAYSGSPVAVSFDEDYEHSVSIVTINGNESPQAESVTIVPFRRLITLPESPVTFKEAIKTLSKLDDNLDCYVRLNVCHEGDLPVDFNEIAIAKTKGKKCRYCTIRSVDLREERKKRNVNLLMLQNSPEPVRMK